MVNPERLSFRLQVVSLICWVLVAMSSAVVNYRIGAVQTEIATLKELQYGHALENIKAQKELYDAELVRATLLLEEAKAFSDVLASEGEHEAVRYLLSPAEKREDPEAALLIRSQRQKVLNDLVLRSSSICMSAIKVHCGENRVMTANWADRIECYAVCEDGEKVVLGPRPAPADPAQRPWWSSLHPRPTASRKP